MKLLPLIASIVFCLSAPLSGAAATVPNDTTYIFLKDYGLHRTKRKNGIKYINKALAELQGDAPKVLVFTPGTYHFYPDGALTKVYYESNTTDVNPKVCAFLFEKVNNLTIDGRGSTLVFHQQMQPFTFDSCQNIVLKNLHIDWENPLIAEAEVLEANQHYLDLAIDARKTPYHIENDKLFFDVGRNTSNPWKSTMEFDRAERIIVPQTGDNGCLGDNWNKYRAVAILPGVVRLYNAFSRLPQKGNILVLRHAERAHAGIFILESKNVRVQNVNLYHATGLGILAQFSENLTFDAYRAIPNPLKKRYAGGGDDGIQVSNCKGPVHIVNCAFAGLMDDPVNVHGTSIRVEEIRNRNQLKCRFMHPQSVGLHWGHPNDSIRFIENEQMFSLGTGQIERFRLLDENTMVVTFKSEIPAQLQIGDALENLSWAPDLVVENSHFGNCRARGLLVSTPGKVRIENNVFESSGSAILISGDANGWYESGAVQDVLIKDNTFAEVCNTSPYQFCEAIISIYPIIPRLNTQTPAFHKNIRIVGNRFQPFDYPLLFARSVDGLTFSENTVTRSFNYKAWHPRQYTFTFEYCREIRMEQNSFSNDILGKSILLKKTPATQLEMDTPSFFEIEKL